MYPVRESVINIAYRDGRVKLRTEVALNFLSYNRTPPGGVQEKYEKDNQEPGRSVYNFKEFTTANCSIVITDSSYKIEPLSKHTSADRDTTSNNPLLLALQRLGIKDFHFSYHKPADKMSMDLHIDTIGLNNASVNLLQQTIHGNRFTMENSSFTAFVWMPGKKPDDVNEYVAETVPAKKLEHKYRYHHFT